MDQIVPGQGGKIRPAEYFDMIGAAGPNALAALLFVKFVRSHLQLTLFSRFRIS
jgi:hypothetical protein